MKTKNLLSILVMSLSLLTTLSAQELYTKSGTDVTWEYIIDNDLIPIGQTSNAGIQGSTIDVNNDHPEIIGGLYGKDPFDKNIRIHTLGNSGVQPNDFSKWSRWYQEDGNTQIFRMFKDEYNTRNDRKNSARIEAFSNFQYDRGDGWQEWTGRYTIVEPIFAAIMQVKDTGAGWASVIKMDYDGDIVYTQPGKKNITLGKNMKGKSFDLRIRDDGYTTEVYYNGEFIGKHNDGVRKKTQLRWGMYVHSNHVARSDGMIFITGARVNGEPVNEINQPPNISFQKPVNNFTVQEGYDSLEVVVNASDSDGAISNVKLYVDDNFVRQESVAPYEWGHNGLSEELLGLAAGQHIVKAVATDDDGDVSEAIFTLTVNQTLTIPNFDNPPDKVGIYPNPVTDNKLFITRSNENTSLIKIVDLSGKTIMIQEVLGKKEELDLTGFTTGSYILTITQNKKTVSKLFFKK